ncbi:MAG: hypothetical protein ABIH82_01605, partial [Candidatus Woesearchaeota archaeon]
PKLIKKEQDELYAGGTSAGLAVQIAHIMGAKEIHLYGCSFDNDARVPYGGERYFYHPKEGEKGHTDKGQRIFLDAIIEVIKSQGTEVFAHGQTRLQSPRNIGD